MQTRDRRTSKWPPWTFRDPVSRPQGINSIETNHPFRKIACLRLAILRAYRGELSRIQKPRMKTRVIKDFLQLYNSGLLLPQGPERIEHISRSTLYNWDKAYKDRGIAGLVPLWKCKWKMGANLAFMNLVPAYTKIVIPGPPQSRGRNGFLSLLGRRWQGPPITGPVALSIFFSMPIPRGTKMKKRMLALRHRTSHTGVPHLGSLVAFILNCMSGIVFKSHSQIVRFHSEKEYRWNPEIRIFVRALLK